MGNDGNDLNQIYLLYLLLSIIALLLSLLSYLFEIPKKIWELIEFIRKKGNSGKIQEKISFINFYKFRLFLSKTFSFCKRLNVVTSKYLYREYYKEANNIIIVHVSTWPVFGEKEGKILEQIGRKLRENPNFKFIIYGPLDSYISLPGFFWRLKMLNADLEDLDNLLFLHIDERRLMFNHKYIIVDNNAFYADKGRRTKYYIKLENGGVERIKKGILESIYREGHDGFIAIYNSIRKAYTERMKVQKLIENLHIKYREEYEKRKEELGKEHERLLDYKNFSEIVSSEILKKFLNFIKRMYKADIRFDNLDDSIDRLGEIRDIERIEVSPPLPKIRIVVTEECNLSCFYCPRFNEGRIGGRNINNITPDNFKKIVDTAYNEGFKEFAITGGEPFMYKDMYKDIKDKDKNKDISSKLKQIIKDKEKTGVVFYINTNGTYRKIREFADELNEYTKNIIFKISMDGFCGEDIQSLINDEEIEELMNDKKINTLLKILGSILDSYEQSSCSEVDKRLFSKIDRFKDIFKNTLYVLEKGYRVGINYVLTRSNQHLLKSMADLLYELSTKLYPGQIYLKILDLNWYRGEFRNPEAINDKYPTFTAMWNSEYVSSVEIYQETLKHEYGPLKRIVSYNTGIPMFEAVKDKFIIRVKDSRFGTHYIYPACYECPYFASGKCQEGIYQPWVIPKNGSYELKLCSLNNEFLKNRLFDNDDKFESQLYKLAELFRNRNLDNGKKKLVFVGPTD